MDPRATGAARTRRGRILTVVLDATSAAPRYQQIYASIRRDIRSGLLQGGTRLPSTRDLARDLAVARSTVVQAYEQLRAEGYVEGVQGAGTRVCAAVPDAFVTPRPGLTSSLRLVPSESRAAFAGRPSHRAQLLHDMPGRLPSQADLAPRAFRPSVPAVDVFPVEIWGKLLARLWARTTPRLLGYSDPFGYRPLREAIAEYLRAARGVRCTAEQVIVVSGSQQGIDLCARTLLDPGDEAWVEDPGYPGARGALIAAGARLVPVPVDAEGLDVRAGVRRAPNARAVHVTPSRQWPLGMMLSPARRVELLAWACAAGAWVLEDDYDSEFRFASRPSPAMHGADDSGCVLYLGTFSKVMFPSMRLGYVVVPERLLDLFRAVRYYMDYHTAHLEQAVMTDFIVEGHFERHIRRMRTIYQERQEILVDAVARELPGRLDVARADAGLSLVGWLRDLPDADVSRAAQRQGIDVIALSRFCLEAQLPPGLLLGYAGVIEADLRDGVRALRRAIDEVERQRRRA